MLSGADILGMAPGLEREADLRVVDFARLPGPHMTPGRMMELAGVLRRELAGREVAGVVVTHGTDTLEETAFLLDLVLSSDKPVVLVGAMRNSSEPGWDGPANLRSAVRVAAAPEARGLGVVVVMNDLVIPGVEATKTHTESMDTFQGRDFGALGVVDKDRILVQRRRGARETIETDRLEERVEVIQLSAGSSGRLIGHAVEAGFRGLVIEGFGRGNVPVTAVDEVEAAARRGLPVVITSRCWRGRVLDTYAYRGGGKPLAQAGVISGGMLPAHKARIKLMLLLGMGADLATIRRSFES